MEENQNIPQVQPAENRQTLVASGQMRNWTSYFKEFIMLFLAITLGFLLKIKEIRSQNKTLK